MLDLSRQFAPLREEILAAIAGVCDSQQFILGPQVGRFEAAAAAACGASHAVGCASGTDALWLALAAGRVGEGDAVITTPFSFFATASAILRAGARPVFAEIDPRSFNLSPASVGEVLRDRPVGGIKGILPVHLFGQCADWEGFEALAVEHAARGHSSLVLIEDAAQAFGAMWNGRHAGSLGLAATFSFYPTKNLSAFGDAGLVTTSSAALAERARRLRNHGVRAEGATRRYHHDEIGWNSRLDSLQAAVLEVKLRHLAGWNERRRALAARYDGLFRSAGLAAESVAGGIVLPYADPRATPIFHQYVIRAPRRDALRDYLAQRNIGSEIYYPVPLHLQPALRDLGYKPGDFPHAERAAAEVLALPIFPELTGDEQETVVEAVRGFYA
jgi:dTDP-4-amino-4,6-dideoxygalactose transaminase